MAQTNIFYPKKLLNQQPPQRGGVAPDPPFGLGQNVYWFLVTLGTLLYYFAMLPPQRSQ